MHDIWNPWHGCIKKSIGCQNCYMYYLDKQRGKDGSVIYKVKNNFDYPLQKDQNGNYKIKSGEQIRVCMTSDFFLPEADVWRSDAWKIMQERPDVVFFLLTKRPERVIDCLPFGWKDGWENIFFNVTCENQQAADERLPILEQLPFKHKGIMVAPFVGQVSIAKYLQKGFIEQVIAGGENYDGSRPLKYEWVKNLYEECVAADIRFAFIETGTYFEKDGKIYHIQSKFKQSQQAYKSGLQHLGKPIIFNLKSLQNNLFESETLIYKPHFRAQCETCGSRLICNGCSDCGNCKNTLKSK